MSDFAKDATGAIVAWPRQAPSSAAVVHGAQRSALQTAGGGVRHARASLGAGEADAPAHDTPPPRTQAATDRKRAVAVRIAR